MCSILAGSRARRSSSASSAASFRLARRALALGSVLPLALGSVLPLALGSVLPLALGSVLPLALGSALPLALGCGGGGSGGEAPPSSVPGELNVGSDLGYNLDFPGDWTNLPPFIDQMKNSRAVVGDCSSDDRNC